MEIKIIKSNTEEFENTINSINSEDFKYITRHTHNLPIGFLFVIKENNDIVALAETYIYDIEDDALGISTISVNSKHTGHGYSKLLLKEIFKLCKELNKDLRVSSYSHEGFWRLKKNIMVLSKQYSINVRESGVLGLPQTEAEEEYINNINIGLELFKLTNKIKRKQSNLFQKFI